MKYSKEWLTQQEFNQIQNNPNISQRNELIISILYWCALRVSEMTNIKTKDIDIQSGNLTLWRSKKSDHPELVHIPDQVLKLINRWIKAQNKQPEEYLIHSQKENKLSRSQVYRITKKLARRANINKEITTHTFRRSRATHLLDAGLPIEKVSRLLRHNKLESTMTYLKISIQDLKNDIKKIDDHVFKEYQFQKLIKNG